MLTWITKLLANHRAKSITQKKLREAYVLKDSKYLRKAYENGRSYLKKQIVFLIGELEVQENFEFLLKELKSIEDIELKSYIYVALMNIALDNKIKITDSDSQYLNQHFHLLENIEFSSYEPKAPEPQPINFRSQLRDHLGMLEEMKRQNEIY